jgi:WD40 repeat protein/serine/threonine protein kinase
MTPTPHEPSSREQRVNEAIGKPTEQPASDLNEQTLAFQERGVPSPNVVIRYFGDYELLQEIARGGMGVVFKARQVSLNRTVAVKMILAGSFAGPEDVERFHIEAQAAAKLDHPGIVPIYEVGQHEGQHYFSMGFVDGRSLAARMAEGPLAAREAAEIVRAVSGAVQYAHELGVIHRDLKPANILLDRRGTPRVTDFGLAKLTESGSDLTGTGQVLGTPSYMPPEQAAAKVSAVGALSDVYSLGAILYGLLTGRPPFQAATPVETLLQVRQQEPVSPRQLNPAIPLDLDTIVLRCLDKSPQRRYASARALKDELNRFLEGRPILARRVGRVERFWRWCRREPVVASLVAAVAFALIAGTSVSAYFAMKERERANSEANMATKNGELAAEKGKLAEENGALAENNKRLFKSERDERTRTQTQLRIATAEKLAALSHATRPQSPELSVALAVESGLAARSNDEGLLPASHQSLLDSLSVIGGRPLVGHHAPITNVEISPDGRWIVTASQDNTVRLWDLTAANPATNSRVLFGELGWSAAAVSPDSHWIVTADLSLRLWDLTAKDPAATHRVLNGGQADIMRLAITPDCRWVVAGEFNGSALVWDLTDPDARPRLLTGHQKQVECLTVSADSRWLATGGGDSTVRVWDLLADDPGSNPRLLTGHTDQVSSLAISSDGHQLVTGSYDTTARVWDLVAADAEPRVLEHPQVVWCVGISPDGRWIVTGSDQARVWNLTAEGPAGEPRLLTGHQNAVRTVAFSRDSATVVTGSWDKTAIVWDMTQTAPTVKAVLAGHSAEIDSVAISPDCRWIVTGARDHAARVWDLTGERFAGNPRVLRVERPHIQDVAISPDGHWLVTGSEEARVWDLKAANPAANPRALAGYRGMIQGIAISPDSRSVAAVCDDHIARVWNLAPDEQDRQPRVLAGHEALILDVEISPDGRWVVTGSADKTVRVWDLGADESTTKPRVLGGHESTVRSVAISPDSRRVVAVAGSAYVWDLSSDEPTAPLVLADDGPVPMIQCAAFSPEGRWVVAGSADKTAHLWDLAAPQPTAKPRLLKGHQNGIYAVAFSTDGRTLVTGSADNTARVWDLAAEDPAATSNILSGHLAIIRTIAVTSDDRWLVTGSDDRTVRIWDLAAPNPGATARILRGHASSVNGVKIVPDGRLIVTWSYDRTARIWRWQWDDLVELAGDVARNLDGAEWNEYFSGKPYHKTFRDLPIPGAPHSAPD